MHFETSCNQNRYNKILFFTKLCNIETLEAKIKLCKYVFGVYIFLDVINSFFGNRVSKLLNSVISNT